MVSLFFGSFERGQSRQSFGDHRLIAVRIGRGDVLGIGDRQSIAVFHLPFGAEGNPPVAHAVFEKIDPTVLRFPALTPQDVLPFLEK